MLCRHTLATWQHFKDHSWYTLPHEYIYSPLFTIDRDFIADFDDDLDYDNLNEMIIKDDDKTDNTDLIADFDNEDDLDYDNLNESIIKDDKNNARDEGEEMVGSSVVGDNEDKGMSDTPAVALDSDDDFITNEGIEKGNSRRVK